MFEIVWKYKKGVYLYIIKQQQNIKKMENSIKLGDFIAGSYKCGCVWGIVTQIKKSNVIIQKCKGVMVDNTYILTDNFVNVTKSRIYRIGLGAGETIA